MTSTPGRTGAVPELLLVTAFYPFAHAGGEMAFLPPELRALSARVQAGELRVRLVPLHRSDRADVVPPGIVLDPTLADLRRAGRWADLGLAWRWPGFFAEMARALRRGGLTGVVRVWRWAAVARGTARWLDRPAQQAATLACSYWRGGATLALARWAAAAPRRVALTRVHRFDLYDDAFTPPFQPWTDVYATLRASVTVADQGLRYLLERGVPGERLHLARLGTPPMPRAAASDDGTWRVLSVSFLRPEKRVPLLAQALVALARQRPQQRIQWTHLGDGPQRRSVEAALAGAPSNLAVDLRGPATPAEVQAHYAQQPVDLFVQVSDSEGLPVAILESLAAGVPVLATDVGGVAEAVDAGVGRLIPATVDAAAIVSALATLLDDPSTWAARRAAALHRWATQFDSRVTHAAYAEWLVGVAREAIEADAPSPSPQDAGRTRQSRPSA